MVMSRRVAVFFYGLFMDAGALRQKGVDPVGLRRARVDGFSLRIGQRASPALCFNLAQPLAAHARNPEYAARLKELARRLELPQSYIDTIGA